MKLSKDFCLPITNIMNITKKNPEFIKELDQILKERNLEDTRKIPKPNHNQPMDCCCISNCMEQNLKDTSKIPKPNHNQPLDCRCMLNCTEICYNCEQ